MAIEDPVEANVAKIYNLVPGVKHFYYESPGTGHEWLTWRRSLHQFAPMLFR